MARFESSVLSVSWIPSEAVTGMMKLPFSAHVAHYDQPLPDVIEDLEALRVADRFRFANELRAWIETDDRPETWGGRTLAATGASARIARYGYSGAGHIGSTTLKLGALEMTFAAVPFPTIQRPPEVGDGWVRFVQTAGGRTGAPAPRKVARPPFVQIAAPTAWTTLALTLHADGRIEYEVVGASPFPRHWIYDAEGKLVAKTGLIDYKDWSNNAFGTKTPWGDEDAPALVTAVETALERQLSLQIMGGGRKPERRKIKAERTLTEQGAPGDELYLLLDGVLAAEVNGERVAEVGPGAIIGERALLEGGTRTATLRALTNVTVAVARADQIDRAALEAVAAGHRREDAG